MGKQEAPTSTRRRWGSRALQPAIFGAAGGTTGEKVATLGLPQPMPVSGVLVKGPSSNTPTQLMSNSI